MKGKSKFLLAAGAVLLLVCVVVIILLVMHKKGAGQTGNADTGQVAEASAALETANESLFEEDGDELEKKGTPAAFNEGSAMLAIFGEYSEEHGGTLIPRQLTDQWDMEQAEELATPLLAKIYQEGDQRKGVLVVQRQMVSDGEVVASHAQQATISVYIFTQKGRRWYFEKGNKEVTEIGAYGEAPERRLIKLGDDKYGILFNGGYANMGQVISYATLIGLSDKSINELGAFDTGEENSGACDEQAEEAEANALDECWSYSGELNFLRDGGKDYYLLGVNYQGTGHQDGQDGIVDVGREEYYQKVGDSYTRVDAKRAADSTPVAQSELEVAEVEGVEGDEGDEGDETTESAAPRQELPHDPAITITEGRLVASGPGPSFDCAQASTTLQQTICKPENSELQAVERKLTALYDKLLAKLPEKQAQWLRESHHNWLAGDAGCIESDYRYGDWAKDCLLDSYRTRLDEMTLGVFANPVLPNQLPYRVVLPNGLEGVFTLKPLTTEGDGEELWFSSGADSRRVGAIASGAKELDTAISLIGVKGDRLLVKITTADAVSYHALDEKNNFVLQGQKSSKEAGEHYWIDFSARWVAGDNGPRLQLDEDYQNAESNFGIAYIHPKDRQRIYQFHFDGQPWEEALPEPQSWLDKPDAAVRYTALYREIIAANKPLAAAPDDCFERGIDWTLASASLAHWLGVVQEARRRGVAYDQAASILGKVLVSNERPTLNEGERELFRALDYMRRKLEANEGWQQQPEAAQDEGANEVEGSDESGAPYLTIGCLNEEEPSFDYVIDREHWFNTFWLRRHADGTYAVAKQVVDYALHSKPAGLSAAR